MPWEKGQSGNPSGSASVRPFMAALKRAILADDGKRIRKAAEALLDKAAEGEPWAIDMLANRTDGKPIQMTEISGPDGGPMQTGLMVRFVTGEKADD